MAARTELTLNIVQRWASQGVGQQAVLATTQAQQTEAEVLAQMDALRLQRANDINHELGRGFTILRTTGAQAGNTLKGVLDIATKQAGALSKETHAVLSNAQAALKQMQTISTTAAGPRPLRADRAELAGQQLSTLSTSLSQVDQATIDELSTSLSALGVDESLVKNLRVLPRQMNEIVSSTGPASTHLHAMAQAERQLSGEARAAAAAIEEQNKRLQDFSGGRNRQQALRTLKDMSSGAHGVMFAFNALNANMTGLLFSLIFMQFSAWKVTAAFAAAALAVGALYKHIDRLRKIKRAIDPLAVSLSRIGLSADLAVDARAAAFALEGMGFKAEDAAKGVGILFSAGFGSADVLKRVANIAALTGRSLEEVAEQFVNLADPTALSIAENTGLEEFEKQLLQLIPLSQLMKDAREEGKNLIEVVAELYAELASITEPEKRASRLAELIAEKWKEIDEIQAVVFKEDGTLTKWGKTLQRSLFDADDALTRARASLVAFQTLLGGTDEIQARFFRALTEGGDLKKLEDLVGQLELIARVQAEVGDTPIEDIELGKDPIGTASVFDVEEAQKAIKEIQQLLKDAGADDLDIIGEDDLVPLKVIRDLQGHISNLFDYLSDDATRTIETFIAEFGLESQNLAWNLSQSIESGQEGTNEAMGDSLTTAAEKWLAEFTLVLTRFGVDPDNFNSALLLAFRDFAVQNDLPINLDDLSPENIKQVVDNFQAWVAANAEQLTITTRLSLPALDALVADLEKAQKEIDALTPLELAAQMRIIDAAASVDGAWETLKKVIDNKETSDSLRAFVHAIGNGKSVRAAWSVLQQAVTDHNVRSLLEAYLLAVGRGESVDEAWQTLWRAIQLYNDTGGLPVDANALADLDTAEDAWEKLKAKLDDLGIIYVPWALESDPTGGMPDWQPPGGVEFPWDWAPEPNTPDSGPTDEEFKRRQQEILDNLPPFEDRSGVTEGPEEHMPPPPGAPSVEDVSGGGPGPMSEGTEDTGLFSWRTLIEGIKRLPERLNFGALNWGPFAPDAAQAEDAQGGDFVQAITDLQHGIREGGSSMVQAGTEVGEEMLAWARKAGYEITQPVEDSAWYLISGAQDAKEELVDAATEAGAITTGGLRASLTSWRDGIVAGSEAAGRITLDMTHQAGRDLADGLQQAGWRVEQSAGDFGYVVLTKAQEAGAELVGSTQTAGTEFHTYAAMSAQEIEARIKAGGEEFFVRANDGSILITGAGQAAADVLGISSEDLLERVKEAGNVTVTAARTASEIQVKAAADAAEEWLTSSLKLIAEQKRMVEGLKKDLSSSSMQGIGAGAGLGVPMHPSMGDNRGVNPALVQAFALGEDATEAEKLQRDINYAMAHNAQEGLDAEDRIDQDYIDKRLERAREIGYEVKQDEESGRWTVTDTGGALKGFKRDWVWGTKGERNPVGGTGKETGETYYKRDWKGDKVYPTFDKETGKWTTEVTYDPETGKKHKTDTGEEVVEAAMGGIVTRPTRLIAGEEGAEAILPLSGAAAMGSVNYLKTLLMGEMGMRMAGGGGGRPITIVEANVDLRGATLMHEQVTPKLLEAIDIGLAKRGRIGRARINTTV